MLTIHKCRIWAECHCRPTSNALARDRSKRRGVHPPPDTRREKEWRQKFNQRLLERGASMEFVLGIDPPIDLASDPADCADEEIWCAMCDSDGLEFGEPC